MTQNAGSGPRRLSPLFTWRSAITEHFELPPGAPRGITTATVKHVGLALSLYMSDRGDRAFPKIETLAEDTSRSRSTVSAALAVLEETGWLTVHRSTGRGRSNSYRATFPKALGERAVSDPSGASTSGDADKGSGARAFSEKGPEPDQKHPGSAPKASGHDAPERHESASESANWDAPRPGKRDLLFEAVVEAKAWDLASITDDERGQANTAAKKLRAVGATPEQVLEFPRWWARAFPELAWEDRKPTVMPPHWSNFMRARSAPRRPGDVDEAFRRIAGAER